jgi:prepilin-type N-terminal cleavage/methylation domain-containing protein
MAAKRLSQGYTLLELMLCISILTVLTGISLISVAAPQQLLTIQGYQIQAKQRLTQARVTAMLTGHSVSISLTPWVWWLDEEKAFTIPQESGWRWQTNLSKITWDAHGHFTLIDTQGQRCLTPQMLQLTYNQKEKVWIDLDSQAQQIQVH